MGSLKFAVYQLYFEWRRMLKLSSFEDSLLGLLDFSEANLHCMIFVTSNLVVARELSYYTLNVKRSVGVYLGIEKITNMLSKQAEDPVIRMPFISVFPYKTQDREVFCFAYNFYICSLPINNFGILITVRSLYCIIFKVTFVQCTVEF